MVFLLHGLITTTPDIAGSSSPPACTNKSPSSPVTSEPLRHAGAQSAQELFEKESLSRRVMTFCQELDAALGGGVATGQVTEFCESAPTVLLQGVSGCKLCPVWAFGGYVWLCMRVPALDHQTQYPKLPIALQVACRRSARRSWGESASEAAVTGKACALSRRQVVCQPARALPELFQKLPLWCAACSCASTCSCRGASAAWGARQSIWVSPNSVCALLLCHPAVSPSIHSWLPAAAAAELQVPFSVARIKPKLHENMRRYGGQLHGGAGCRDGGGLPVPPEQDIAPQHCCTGAAPAKLAPNVRMLSQSGSTRH